MATPTNLLRLHNYSPAIGWRASRCLQPSPHPLDCSRCLDACPTSALSFQDRGTGKQLITSDACHGCSQCVPACPTEALVSTEINDLLDEKADINPLQLSCHRLAPDPQFTRVHCLRALGRDTFAWLAAKNPGGVTLHLPDQCRGCRAGVASAEGADNWLAMVTTYAEIQDQTAESEYRAAPASVSRRDLLLGRAAPALPFVRSGDTAPRARRQLRELSALELQSTTQRQPALPQLTLNAEACEAHGVCARVCPTDALQESATGELIFKPDFCLDCGHCLSGCPEQALTMNYTTTRDIQLLRETQAVTCFDCGNHFKPSATQHHANTPRCPACQREQQMIKESFHELFG